MTEQNEQVQEASFWNENAEPWGGHVELTDAHRAGRFASTERDDLIYSSDRFTSLTTRAVNYIYRNSAGFIYLVSRLHDEEDDGSFPMTEVIWLSTPNAIEYLEERGCEETITKHFQEHVE